MSDRVFFNLKYHGNIYGHEEVIRNYANWGEEEEFCAAIEHAPYLGNVIYSNEVNCTYPLLIVSSPVRARYLRSFVNKIIYPIGPYIRYADLLLREEHIAREKERLGRSLLIFPPHSNETTEVRVEDHAFFKEIEVLSERFDTVRVCLGFRDIVNGNLECFADLGYEIITAGFCWDVDFLPRLRTLIELSAMTVSTGIGSHIGYCVALGVPHWVFPRQMVFKNKSGLPPDRISDVQSWEKKGTEEVLSHFTKFDEEITPSQKEAVDRYFGAGAMRSGDQIKEALSNACEIHRRGTHLSALGISPRRDHLSVNSLLRFAGHHKSTGRASFTISRLPMARQLALMELADDDGMRRWLWDREVETGDKESVPPLQSSRYLDSLPQAVRLATKRLFRCSAEFEKSMNSDSSDNADSLIGNLSDQILIRHLIPLRNTWYRVGLFRFWCGLMFNVREQYREAAAEYLAALRFGYTTEKVYSFLDRCLAEIEKFFGVSEPTMVRAQPEFCIEGLHQKVPESPSESRVRELFIWIELLATAAGNFPSWLTEILVEPQSSISEKVDLPCAWAMLTSQHLNLPRQQLRRFLDSLPLSRINLSIRHEFFRRYYNPLMEEARSKDYAGMLDELDDLRELFGRKGMDRLCDSLDYHYALAHYADGNSSALEESLERQLNRIPDHRAALALREEIVIREGASVLQIY